MAFGSFSSSLSEKTRDKIKTHEEKKHEKSWEIQSTQEYDSYLRDFKQREKEREIEM